MGPWNAALITVSLNMVARLVDAEDWPSAVRMATTIVQTATEEDMWLTDEEEHFLFNVIFSKELD
tara:strand:+ start:1454 stop:1648 length:195 start_codon:yes stop_codon:yes gene_type:complete